jgi:hypothetical protein
MNYRTIIDKLDPDEWSIPEKFLSANEEFLQALVDKVEEQCNIDLVSKPFICGNCLISEDKCECKKPLDFGMVEEYYDEKRKCWATRFVKD